MAAYAHQRARISPGHLDPVPPAWWCCCAGLAGHAAGVFSTPGVWRFVGPRTAIQDEYVACSPARQSQRAPGQPMVDQFGLQVRTPDGSLVLRPASGQQNIDPRTGLPMVDAQGQPVLVP